MFDEIFGERVEQFRVGRRIGRPEIIDGINKAAAEKISPHSINSGFCELIVPGRSHPVGQLPPQTDFFFRSFPAIQKGWLHRLLGPRVYSPAPSFWANIGWEIKRETIVKE